VTDPVIRNFWLHEFASMPPKLQAEAVAPVYNKVGQLISNPLLRNILGQARSTLNLRKIMDEGKVLLVNLSKGRVGEDASALRLYGVLPARRARRRGPHRAARRRPDPEGPSHAPPLPGIREVARPWPSRPAIHAADVAAAHAVAAA
jgi:hypothetical protein